LGNISLTNTEQSLYSVERSSGEVPRDDAPWRIENILENGPPSEAQWWDEEYLSEKDDSDNIEWTEDSTEDSKRFHNCGFEIWKKGRTEWKKVTVKARHPKPPPVRYDQVVRGLRQGGRNFDLPGRMNLKDIVEVYTALWECNDPL